MLRLTYFLTMWKVRSNRVTAVLYLIHWVAILMLLNIALNVKVIDEVAKMAAAVVSYCILIASQLFSFLHSLLLFISIFIFIFIYILPF